MLGVGHNSRHAASLERIPDAGPVSIAPARGFSPIDGARLVAREFIRGQAAPSIGAKRARLIQIHPDAERHRSACLRGA